jgi:hypothetical protein
VLGVWVDPQMSWKEHVKEVAKKGLAAYEALSGIVTSTWGPSMRRSRLIYTAIVRPTMMYGAQAWAVGGNLIRLHRRATAVQSMDDGMPKHFPL